MQESTRDRRTRILVWDLPVRLFHWSLVILVVAAWLTGGGGERWHEIAGGGVAGLIAFRLLWGVAGSRHARFRDFVKGPRTTFAYAIALLRGRPHRYIGHNPLGGLMIIALISVLACLCATGFMMKTVMFFGVWWVEAMHAASANALLALVPFHILGVVVSSALHRENLMWAMVSGHKPIATPSFEDRRNYSRFAQLEQQVRGAYGFTVLLLLMAAGFGYGWSVATRHVEIVSPLALIPEVTAPERLGGTQELRMGTRPVTPRSVAPAKPAGIEHHLIERPGTDIGVRLAELPNAPFSMIPKSVTLAGAGEIRIRGTLTGPSSIDGVKFRIDQATRLDSDLMPGDRVELRGYTGTDGALLARRLRRR